MYPILIEGAIVFVNVFTYITLWAGSSEKTVSSFFVDTVNSELKSSSIITASLSVAHLIYSFRFDALAVIPLGKLRNGVMWSTDAFVFASCEVRIPSRIIGGVVAEIVMILGYFVFEGFLYGFAPSVVNIPPNGVQGVAGIIVGILLVKIFEKSKIF